MTGNRSNASASLGAPMEAMVIMTKTAAASSVGAEGTAPTAKGMTMMAFMVKSIARHQKTKQIGVWQGRSKKKTVRSERKNVWHCDTLKLNYRKRLKNVKSKRHSRRC